MNAYRCLCALIWGFLFVLAAGSLPARSLRVSNAEVERGEQVMLPIFFESEGNENAIAFSLQFDPGVFNFVAFELSPSLPEGIISFVNDREGAAGRLGVLLGMSPEEAFPAGIHEVLVLILEAQPEGRSVESMILFSPVPVKPSASDIQANTLATFYQPGKVSVIGEDPVVSSPGGSGSSGVVNSEGATGAASNDSGSEGQATIGAPLPGGLRPILGSGPGTGAGGATGPIGVDSAQGGAAAGAPEAVTSGAVLSSGASSSIDRSTSGAVAQGMGEGASDADTSASAPVVIVQSPEQRPKPYYTTAAADDPLKYYQIKYSRNGKPVPLRFIKVTRDGVQIGGVAGRRDALKIMRRKDCPQPPPPIKEVRTEGRMAKIYSEAPILKLFAGGGIERLTTKDAYVEQIVTPSLREARMLARRNANAKTHLVVSGAGAAGMPKGVIRLRGVAIEQLDVPLGAFYTIKSLQDRPAKEKTKPSSGKGKVLVPKGDPLESRSAK